MTKLPIQNQGFRLDLNLEESFDDDAAWDNLYNPGISADLSILKNNLRNTSILGAPSVSISLTTDETNNTKYGVNGTTTIAPHFFTFNTIQADGSIGAITDSTFTNDDVVQFNETITFNVGDGSGDVATGQEEFTTPGTHSWTAPPGVTQVSVVAIGGGGNGLSAEGKYRAGGGGGLGYRNNISVTPQQSYTVVVGDAGGQNIQIAMKGEDGEDSYFINTSTVKGGGGYGGGGGGGTGGSSANPTGQGGDYVGDGGGNGGDGGMGGSNFGSTGASSGDGAGGGGAGGYAGDGGDGASFPGGGGGDGAGGGGGGGGCNPQNAPGYTTGGDGGGTGIKGQGANGAGGVQGNTQGGGAGGAGSSHGQSDVLYGGGGGGERYTGSTPGQGGSGAVRIIWGVVNNVRRAFPSTHTADQITVEPGGNGSGTVGSLNTHTFYSGQNYYVCDSDARSRFKLSSTRSTDATGISTIPIISVNDGTNHGSDPHQHGSFTSTFGFIRNDGVTAPNLNSFIIPEILDDSFSYLHSKGINGSFSDNLSIYEYTEIVAEKKYRTNKSLFSDRDIKYEGSVRVKDPGNYNSGTTQLGAKNEDGTPNTPGIFIGNTRAFSTDNNPWSKSRNIIRWENGVIVETMTFATESHADEFTIGDLEFGGETNASGEITGGEIKIKGLNIDGSEIQDISSSDSKLINLLKNTPRNVYKFPMIINDETFYILVEREQADNLT